MTRMLSVLVVLACALAMPGTALGQETNAPPGNSAIDEYLETVPGTTGNQVPRDPGSKAERVLTPGQRAKLERLGPDGKALVAAIEATAPPPAAQPAQKIDLDDAEGRSPISAVLDAALGGDSGEGMGIFLPIILLATLLGMIVLLVLRRRSAS